jgi:intermembrane space import and assembly protein 40
MMEPGAGNLKMKKDVEYRLNGSSEIESLKNQDANQNKENLRSESNTTPQTAINEETGEINWDCPCLKSALEPPCGDLFKQAFSCFVSSKAEPKGSDCMEKFVAMQECFRAHPEIYMNDDGAGASST